MNIDRVLFALMWAAFAMLGLVAASIAMILVVSGWQWMFGHSAGALLALLADIVFIFAFVGAYTYPRSK